MALHLAIALAGATLIGSPESGGTLPPGDIPATKAETFAASAGQVLGAASACDEIEKGRLAAAGQKVDDAVQGEGGDNDEMTSAHDMFVVAAADGRRPGRNGNTNSEDPAAHFAKLEP